MLAEPAATDVLVKELYARLPPTPVDYDALIAPLPRMSLINLHNILGGSISAILAAGVAVYFAR